MAKALGLTDSVTACECCGKSPLKMTVIMELDNGDIVHYGTTCAARNTGKKWGQISREVHDEADRVKREAQAEYRASPEYLAYRAALARRPAGLLGRAAMEYVQAEGDADDAARARIAAKFNLRSFALL